MILAVLPLLLLASCGISFRVSRSSTSASAEMKGSKVKLRFEGDCESDKEAKRLVRSAALAICEDGEKFVITSKNKSAYMCTDGRYKAIITGYCKVE